MHKIENFEVEITTLNRTRKVWVYLPDGYERESDKRYPVIYMHDGQNLFYDKLTAYGAAWHVERAIDGICAATGNACIVVGVECLPERRLSEYSPWKMTPLAYLANKNPQDKCNRGGEGGAYGEWFATALKQLIDKRYNTDPSRNATAVAGSSMGGLISCYLGLKYQQIYETMGLFSTYTEFNQWAFDKFVRSTPQTEKQHAFVYCGGKEWGEGDKGNRVMVRNSVRLYDVLAKRNVACELVLNSELPHYETAWEIYFRKFAQDFLSRYYTSKTT